MRTDWDKKYKKLCITELNELLIQVNERSDDDEYDLEYKEN